MRNSGFPLWCQAWLIAGIATVALAPNVSASDSEALSVKGCQICNPPSAECHHRRGLQLAGLKGHRAGDGTGCACSNGLKTASWDRFPEKPDKSLDHPQSVVEDSYRMSRQAYPENHRLIISCLATMLKQ